MPSPWTSPLLNKVPAIVVSFWVIKVLATTVGETGADFLAFNMNFGPVFTGALMVSLMVATLALQLRERRYVPWVYWLGVVLVSVVGTLVTDGVTDGFEVSLFVSTAVFAAALATTFVLWYRSERTLSIHTIVTRRRELYYWFAILFTFALGTAAGDLAAEQLRLGYAVSLLVFAGIIAAVAVAYFAFGMNSILAFWIAYVLTRPLGASLGDLLSQPRDNGGLALGTVGTSAAFLAVIVGLVVVLTVRNRHVEAGGAA